MSSDFSYTPPDAGQYFKAVLRSLKKKEHTDLYDLLKNAQCSFSMSNSFSRKRWNAMYTTVVFRLPMSDFDKIGIEEDNLSRETLVKICDNLMPPEAGLDIMHVEFSPQFETIGENKTLENDLEEIANVLNETTAEFALPYDITEKGKQMAEVYLYLYAVENYLRLFVAKVCTKIHGDDFFNKLNIPKSISNSIVVRRNQEEKNQWVSIRGASELFYLDFKEIGTLIQNNWDIFKSYFPDPSWISSKIDELGNCRNLVAHNSFLGDHERDVIRVYFRSIIKQLNTPNN